MCFVSESRSINVTSKTAFLYTKTKKREGTNEANQFISVCRRMRAVRFSVNLVNAKVIDK